MAACAERRMSRACDTVGEMHHNSFDCRYKYIPAVASVVSLQMSHDMHTLSSTAAKFLSAKSFLFFLVSMLSS